MHQAARAAHAQGPAVHGRCRAAADRRRRGAGSAAGRFAQHFVSGAAPLWQWQALCQARPVFGEPAMRQSAANVLAAIARRSAVERRRRWRNLPRRLVLERGAARAESKTPPRRHARYRAFSLRCCNWSMPRVASGSHAQHPAGPGCPGRGRPSDPPTTPSISPKATASSAGSSRRCGCSTLRPVMTCPTIRWNSTNWPCCSGSPTGQRSAIA